MSPSPLVQCPHANRCSGCPLIELAPEAQLAWKAERVRDAVVPFADLALAEIAPIVAAPIVEGYRRRAKLIAAPPARLGLFARGTDHEVVDIPDCRVLGPAIADAAAAIRAALAAPASTGRSSFGAFDPKHPVRHAIGLRAVDLRETRLGSATDVMVTLILSAESERHSDALLGVAQTLFQAIPRCASLAVSFHDGHSPQVLGRRLRVLGGRTSVPDALPSLAAAGPSTTPVAQPPLSQLAAHGAFVQVHREQAAAVTTRVGAALADALGGLAGTRILELFGGSGALGLPLASGGAEVVSIESFEPAVTRANDAAFNLGLGGFRAIAADATDEAIARSTSGERFDAVLVNPPRRGVTPAAREAIARLAPRAVVYVSCDPDTLARDLAHLAILGLATTRIVPFDMIPLTEEIECVAVLEPTPAPVPRVLFESTEIVAVDKPAPEPTIPHPEHPGSLLARVRRLPGCDAATPIHRLDTGTSGVVLFARRPEHVAAWAKALTAESAEKTYLALVRGIVRAKGSISREVREQGRRLPARTRYRRSDVIAGHSLVEVRPDQGRTHQIRQHLAMIDHAVLGDARYGHAPSNRHVSERYGLDRTFLHCARIALDDPATGSRLVVESPLAPDLAAVRARMLGAGRAPLDVER
ncbi:MAG: pseudouridine synthase [bacterium]